VHPGRRRRSRGRHRCSQRGLTADHAVAIVNNRGTITEQFLIDATCPAGAAAGRHRVPRRSNLASPMRIDAAQGLSLVCRVTTMRRSGAASGASTQIGFEVEDIDEAVAELRARGARFEPFDIAGFEVEHDIVRVPNNYPSKGSGERGAFFHDSEGNLLALGQASH
jgi:hypothetical protein